MQDQFWCVLSLMPSKNALPAILSVKEHPECPTLEIQQRTIFGVFSLGENGVN